MKTFAFLLIQVISISLLAAEKPTHQLVLVSELQIENNIDRYEGLVNTTLAIDYTWNGSVSSSWTVSNNWTPNGTPSSTDNVTIDNSTNAPILNSTVSINNLIINGTGILTLNLSANLTINGNFTYDNSSGASVNINATSTVNFANSSAVTIPAVSYGTLNRSGNGTTTLSGNGTIAIKTAFTPGTATYITIGSTVDFASTSLQSIPAFSYYNLSNSGNGTRNLPSGTINIAGSYTPTTGTINFSTNTMNFSASGSQTIPAANYYNISNSGNGPRVYSSTGIIKINGDTHTPSTNTNTTSGSTIELATSSTMTMSSFPYNNIIFSGSGFVSFGQGVNLNLTGYFKVTGTGILKIGTGGGSNSLTVQSDFNIESTCSSCQVYLISNSSSTGAILTVNGNMNLDGGNNAQLSLEHTASSVGAGVVNIFGNLIVTTPSSFNGIINFGEGGTNVGNKLVLYGNLNKSGNSFFTTSGTGPPDGFIFNKTGEQSFNYSGTTSSHMRWQVNSGSTLKLNTNFPFDLSNSVPLNSLTIMTGGTIDMGTFALTGGNVSTFTLSSGATIKTANNAGINSSGSTGSIQNIGSRVFDSGATYELQGSSTGIFTTTPTANTIKNMVINNNGSYVNLNQNLTLSGSLIFTNGQLRLNNNNLILNSGAVSGYNTNKYIITNGTGTLKINSINSVTQVFPIGPNEFFYNPFSFANTGSTLNVTASVYETITNSSNIDPNKIVNVEWNITPSATANASLVFNWNASQQGSSFNSLIAKIYHYNPPWAYLSNSTASGTMASVSGVTNFSPFLVGNQNFYLPIELSSFYGECKEDINVLHFITQSEKDADKISIERADAIGNSFKEIASVKAKGNSNIETIYEFTDVKPLPVSYYRLKLIDLDMAYVYSKIIVLSNKELNEEITLYPNPVNDVLNLEFISSYEADIEINITDPLGKIMLNSNYPALKGFNKWVFNLTGFSPGLYYCIVKKDQNFSNYRFIKK